jgi:hypothetical protein
MHVAPVPTSPTSRHRHQHKDTRLPPLACPLQTGTARGHSWTVTAAEAHGTSRTPRPPGTGARRAA